MFTMAEVLAKSPEAQATDVSKPEEVSNGGQVDTKSPTKRSSVRHFSATLIDGFPWFFLSRKVNARV